MVYINASTITITVKHNYKHGITTTRITVFCTITFTVSNHNQNHGIDTTEISAITIKITVIYQKQSLVVKEK